MSDNNNDFFTFFTGMVIGSLVGAATALMLAPQSGEETRALLRDKSIELKDKAVEYSQDVQMRAEKTLQDTREQLDVVVEELGRLLSREKEHAKSVAQEVKQTATEPKKASG